MGVYFITDGVYTKIGVSKNVKQRIAKLQTASPRKLETLFVLPGGEELEKQFHAAFADKRRHGEWFELTEQDLVLARASLAQDAPPATRYVVKLLNEQTISRLEDVLSGSPLDIDFVETSTVGYSDGEELEAGVRRTLQELSASESVQENYEILLQAALLDLRYNNPRSSWLQPPIDVLVERHGERVLARDPDLAESGLHYAGALVRGSRCRQYLPLVDAPVELAKTLLGVASPEFCLGVTKKSYIALQEKRIVLGFDNV